jgi:hypothetical protein
MNDDIDMKLEPIIKTENDEILKETQSEMDNKIEEDENEEECDDDNDPIEKEIDVYISKSLANNIYVLQVFIS